MRSRFAITAMLVLGLLLSSGGVGMALSGSSGSGSAGQAQYPTTPTTPTTPTKHHHHTPGGGNGNVLGATKTGGTNSTPTTPAAAVPAVQATAQLSTPSSDSQLPFTGLAVIPIILIGVALLIVGLVLRRRTRDAPTA